MYVKYYIYMCDYTNLLKHILIRFRAKVVAVLFFKIQFYFYKYFHVVLYVIFKFSIFNVNYATYGI